MPLTNPYQDTIDWYDQQMAPQPSEEDLSRQRLEAIESEYENILKTNPERDPYILEQGMQAIREDPIAPYNYPTVDDLEQWGNERIKANEPGYGEVIGKGLMRGVQGLAGGVGSITHWAGEAAGIEPLARVGKEASEYWTKAAQEGTFARDPGIYRGTFMQHPSFKRTIGIISEALPSLAAALMTGGAGVAAGLSRTASGWLAGSALGLLEGAPQYEQAREAGKTVSEASISGLASTVGTAILESLAVGKFLRMGRQAERIGKKAGRIAAKAPAIAGAGKGMVVEGMQEGSQQLWQNLVAKLGYDDTQDLAEGLIESMIGGAGAGGFAGGAMTKLNRIAEKAKEKGLADEDVTAAIEDLKGDIENTTQQQIRNLTERSPEEWQTLKEMQGPHIVASEILNQAGILDDTLQLRSIHQALADPQANIADRFAAVNQVKNVLKSINANLAKTWTDNAYVAIYNNLPIPIGKNLAATEIDDSVQVPVSPVDQKIAQAFDVLDRKFATRSGGIVEVLAEGIRPTEAPRSSKEVKPTPTPQMGPTPIQQLRGQLRRPVVEGKAKFVEKEKEKPAEEILPEFHNTEEALTFGKKATSKQKELLAERRKKTEKDYRKAMDADDLDQAVIEATKAQFDREALESAEGTLNVPTIKKALPVEKAAAASETGKGIGGELKGAIPIKTPSGRWTFAGKVPTELSYERIDGTPLTDEDIKNIKQHGPGLFKKTIKSVSWASKEDALEAAKRLSEGKPVKEPLTREQKLAKISQEAETKNRKRANNAKTFRTWLKWAGGIQRKDKTWAGEIRDIVGKRGMKGMPPGIFKKSALGIDEMTEKAIEAGWLRKGATEEDFIRALEENPRERVSEIGGEEWLDKRYEEEYNRYIEGLRDEGYSEADIRRADRTGTSEEIDRIEAEISRLERKDEYQDGDSDGLDIWFTKEQQTLFGKPEQRPFELTPEELTGKEKLAKAQDEAKRKGIQKKGKRLVKGIKPPITGKQQGLFTPTEDQKQTELFTEKAFDEGTETPNNEQAAYDARPEEQPKIALKEPVRLPGAPRMQYRSTGRIKAAKRDIQNVQDLASLLASLRKRSSETFYSVAVDKNGRILEVNEHSAGGPSSAYVLPRVLVGRALRLPDVAKVYYAHNHPSTAIKESPEDVEMTTALNALMQMAGIETQSIILGGDSFVELNELGTFDVEKIKPVLRKEYIPRVARRFGRAYRPQQTKITNPEIAKEFFKENFPNDSGVLLVDRQNRPLAFVPFVKGRTMRQTTRDILALAEDTNAGAMIAKNDTDNENIESYVDALLRIGIGKMMVLDSIEKGLSFKNAEIQHRQPIFPDIAQRLLGSDEDRFSLREAYRQAQIPESAKLGVSADRLNRLATAIQGRWKNAPPITVVEKQSELPDALRRQQPGKIISGAYHNGQVYLVAENMLSRSFARKTIAHEVVGHHGFNVLREIPEIAPRLDRFLDRLYRTQKEAIDGIAERYGYDTGTKDGTLLASEEWLARAAETNPRDTWVRRAVAMVRQWLAKVFPGLKVSNSEIATWIGQMRKAVVKGKAAAPTAAEDAARLQLAGRKAVGAPTGQLAKAQEMLDQGKTEQEIWDETGWTKEASGKWAFRIDDSGAKLKTKDMPLDKEMPLGDVLEHSELFKAYPDAQSIPIRLIETDEYSGSFDGKLITLSTKSKNKLGTILHEVQHWIQRKENFSEGGNYASIVFDQVAISHWKWQLGRAIENIENALKNPRVKKTYLGKGEYKTEPWYLATFIVSDNPFSSMTKPASIRSVETKQDAKDKLKEFKGLLVEATNLYNKLKAGEQPTLDESISFYQNLAGEIYAREAGSQFTGFPGTMEGIPRDQWIVKDGKGTSFSLTPPSKPATEKPMTEKGEGRIPTVSPEAEGGDTGIRLLDDLLYKTPTDKEIKSLNTYLQQNKDKTIRLYHGTNADFDIANEGLKPTSSRTRKSLQSASGFVSLSVYPGMARTFGEMAYPGKAIKVHAVEIPISKLKADLDQLRNRRLFAEQEVGNTLAESLVYGHGAKVKGPVEPYQISEYIEPSRSPLEGEPRFKAQTPEEYARDFLKAYIEAQPKADREATQKIIEKEQKATDETLQKDQITLWDTIKKLPTVSKKGWKEGKPDFKSWQRLLSVPSHFFHEIESMGRVYNAGLENQDNRNRLKDEILKATDETYHTQNLDLLRKQDKQQYVRLTKYLKHRDQNQIGYRVFKNLDTDQWELYSPKDKKTPIATFEREFEAVDAMIRAEGADYLKAGATEQAANALMGFRRAANNGFEILFQAMRDLMRHYQETGQELPSKTVNIDGKAVKVNLKLALAKMGDMRGYYFPRIRKPGRYVGYAMKKGAHPIRQHFDTKTMLAAWQTKMESRGYTVTKETQKRMPEDVFEMAGQVVAQEAIINEALNRIRTKKFVLEDFGLDSVDRRLGPGKRDFMVKGPTSKELNTLFKKMGGRFFPSDPGGPRVWHFENPGAYFESRLAKAIAFEKAAIDVDLSTQAMFAKALVEQVANVIKARGSRQHMIGRREAKGLEVWEGYEEDPAIALGKYGQSVAAGEAKKIMARDMLAAFTGTDISWAQFQEMEGKDATYENYLEFVENRRVDPVNQQNAYKEGKTYIQHMLRNDEAIDRLTGTIKGLAVLKYLAGRVSAPLVNLTALATSVPASMNGFGNVPLHKSFNYIARASRYYRTYAFGDKNKLPKDVRRLFDEIHENGWHDAQYNREALAVLKSKAGRGWDRMIDWAMLGFGATEKLNRVSTIAGAYLGLKDQGQTDHDAMLTLSKKISDQAHATYGKANWPLLARGTHPAAHITKAFYVFRTFSHNYLLTMKDLWGTGWTPEHGKAFTYMAISPAILAGAGGVVGWEIIMAALGKLIDSDDPEEDMYAWLEANIGESAERFARFGGFGLIGMNLKGSLEIGVTDLPTNFKDLLGAPGSVIGDIYEGGKSIVKGDVSKGFEKIAPLAIAAPIKAYREATEGLTTRTNAPIFYGNKQAKADMSEAILRALSFNPAGIAKIREQRWSETQQEQKYRDMSRDIYSKIKKFMLQPIQDRDKADWFDILEDIREYNERIKRMRLIGIVPFITEKSIKINIKRSFRPSKKELRRRMAVNE